MKSKDNGRFMPRKDYLRCVERVYENDSTDYLIALRDALTILISNRIGDFKNKEFKYEGYVKYV